MTFLPIVERELRAEARHSFTYWLRVLGASVLFGVLLVTILDRPGAEEGAALFSSLNTAMFIAIWTLVPLLTADCLSRERREGTLGLLFLTPLTSSAIVVGKSLTHCLRAVTMLLASLPVLSVPFLLGGVTWREGVMALLLNLSSAVLALCAGLVASSRCKSWIRALVLSEIFAVMFLVVFGALVLFAVSMQVAVPYVPFSEWADASLIELIAGAAALCTGAGEVWSQASVFLPPAGLRAWVWTTVEVFLITLLITAIMISFVARRLRRIWREEPPSTRKLRWQSFLLAPRFCIALFQRKMHRTLERNPIGWLHQYSTGARVTKWGWCLLIVVVESWVFASTVWYRFEEPQYWLAMLLASGLAFSAAGSFRRERENGAMELMLVSPLTVRQIVFGRLRGLWSQFLPAVSLVFWLSIMPPQFNYRELWSSLFVSSRGPDLVLPILLLSGFLAVPVVGLYLSLSLKNFLTSWLCTLVICFVLPLSAVWLMAILRRWLFYVFTWDRNPLGDLGGIEGSWLLAGTQILLAVAAVSLLFRNLRCRKFALSS